MPKTNAVVLKFPSQSAVRPTVTLTSPARARQLADAAAKKLESWLETGVPAAYRDDGDGFSPASFKSARYDWHPDLPWDSGAVFAYRHLLKRHAATVASVREVFGYDLAAELRGLAEEKGE